MTRYLHPYRMGDTIITTSDIRVMTAGDKTLDLPKGSRGQVQQTHGDLIAIRFERHPNSLHHIHHRDIKFAPRGIRK